MRGSNPPQLLCVCGSVTMTLTSSIAPGRIILKHNTSHAELCMSHRRPVCLRLRDNTADGCHSF